MDVQVALVVILSLLTVNLVVVGVYIVMVLKEFRETVRKLNAVLSSVQTVADSVVNPVTSLSSLFSGVTSGIKMFSAIKSIRKRKEEK